MSRYWLDDRCFYGTLNLTNEKRIWKKYSVPCVSHDKTIQNAKVWNFNSFLDSSKNKCSFPSSLIQYITYTLPHRIVFNFTPFTVTDWLVGQESKLEMRRIPPLPHKYFILLWKTLYALVLNTDDQSPSQEQQVRPNTSTLCSTVPYSWILPRGTCSSVVGTVPVPCHSKKSKPSIKKNPAPLNADLDFHFFFNADSDLSGNDEILSLLTKFISRLLILYRRRSPALKQKFFSVLLIFINEMFYT